MFQRGSEVVRLETRVDAQTDEYVVVVGWSDKAPQSERYRDYAAFHARIVNLEQQLAADNWVQLGEPTILKDGWRGP